MGFGWGSSPGHDRGSPMHRSPCRRQAEHRRSGPGGQLCNRDTAPPSEGAGPWVWPPTPAPASPSGGPVAAAWPDGRRRRGRWGPPAASQRQRPAAHACAPPAPAARAGPAGGCVVVVAVVVGGWVDGAVGPARTLQASSEATRKWAGKDCALLCTAASLPMRLKQQASEGGTPASCWQVCRRSLQNSQAVVQSPGPSSAAAQLLRASPGAAAGALHAPAVRPSSARLHLRLLLLRVAPRLLLRHEAVWHLQPA